MNAPANMRPLETFDRADFELRDRNVLQARRHLASMSPERRAQLEAEWSDDIPVSFRRMYGEQAL